MTPSFFCAGERLFAQLVPALVELALVLVGPRLGHVVRRSGWRRWRSRRRTACRATGPSGRAASGSCGRRGPREGSSPSVGHPDDRVVLGQDRVVLARLTAEESVEVVESQPARPAIERAGGALLVVGRQVPLAERGGGVAVALEDLGDAGGALGPRRVVARPAAGELGDRAEAHGVMVAARQQRGARRRAERRHVEPVVAQALAGQLGRASASGTGRRTSTGCRSRRRRSAPAARSGARGVPSPAAGSPASSPRACVWRRL